MKKFRKAIVAILVLVLVLTLFVACGDKNNKTDAPSDSQTGQGEQGGGNQGGQGEQGGGNQGEQGGGNQGGQGEQSPYFDYTLSEIFAKYAEPDEWNFTAQYDAYVYSMNKPNYSYTFGFMGAFTMSVGYVKDGRTHQDYYVCEDAYYLDNLDGTHTKYLAGTDGYNQNADYIESELFYIDGLGNYSFEHFDLESTEGMSGKFNQYYAKNAVEAGNGILGEWAEDTEYGSKTYWKRIEVYLQGENIYKLVAIAQCDYLTEDAETDSYDYKYEITFSDFGKVDFDLGDLTIKSDSVTGGGDTPVEPKNYSIVFTDQYLGSKNTDIVFETTSVANSMDSNRGIQYMQANGTVQIVSTGSLVNVSSVTLELNTNADNGMSVEVLVGSTNMLCNGSKTGTVAKGDYTANTKVTFSATEALDGKLTIKLIPTGSKKSMYIKSVEVVCGGTTGGGGTTTPTEVMPAQNFNAATLDKSTLREKMIECYGADSVLPLESTGNYHCLVVPVDFSDYAHTNLQLDNLNKAFNGTTEDTGWQSVKTYYQTSSYGKLDMTFDIQSVYRAKYDSAHYEKADKTVTYNGESVAVAGDQFILEEVLAWITPQIDLSVYDHDNNGVLDAIWIIYTAPVVYGDSSDEEASTSSDDESIYWAYVTTYAKDDGDGTTYDNLDLGQYLFAGFDFMNEFTGNANDPYFDASEEVDLTISGLKINASTYIHETGHLLGLDDYYDYDQTKGSTSGLGGADMMDQTVGDQNPYSKMMLGWVNPTVITTTQTVTLNPFESNGSCIMVLLDYNGTYFSEYLLIDLYTNTGLNAAHANQANSYLYYDYDTEKGATYGVRIYHVSSDIDNPYSDDHWSFTTNNNSYSDIPLIELVQADGEKDFSSDKLGLCNADDLWKAGQKLSTVFPNYARNDNKKVNFDIEIVSVSATQATVTITFAA